ncbi:MAG: hypothetical protein K6T56_09295 [Burkholderiales bacterium]|nr:hypothetical protein [Burkholderiales bacterium]
MAFAVGNIGGTHGLGGAFIIAPFAVAICRLSVYTVAGPALAGTLATSLVRPIPFSGLPTPAGVSTQRDWPLGLLSGFGGIAGMEWRGVRS